ncbi:MAG TPA: ATPase F0F1 [Cyanothece sp. UBA12306]|nr:ATPase F0F1 [Cyanothece sp. UBA12306]
METSKSPKKNHHQRQARFVHKIATKQSHKLRARQEKHKGIWFGLGLLGLIGWSVVIPTLLGLAAGIWIDHQFPSSLSWTLMLMFVGLILGCCNAWNWVKREQKEIEKMQDLTDD